MDKKEKIQNSFSNEKQDTISKTNETNPQESGLSKFYVEEELTVRKLIELGGNLGHKIVDKSMQNFIQDKTSNGSLINMEATIRCINNINEFIKNKILNEYQIVFIGHKKRSEFNDPILTFSKECKSHFLPKVWGGVLTNFKTTYDRICEYRNLLNDEALHKKNLKTKFENSAIQIIKNHIKMIEEEKKSFALYDGIINLNYVSKTIFIASDISQLSSFIKELKQMNSTLPFESWSFLVSISDVNVNISEFITPDNMSQFLSVGLQSPVLPIPANPNKMAVCCAILGDLYANIKFAMSQYIPKTSDKKA